MIKFKKNYKETAFTCPNCGEIIWADLFKDKDLNARKRTRLRMVKKEAKK